MSTLLEGFLQGTYQSQTPILKQLYILPPQKKTSFPKIKKPYFPRRGTTPKVHSSIQTLKPQLVEIRPLIPTLTIDIDKLLSENRQ